MQLKAPLALPFIILRDGWKPKTAQMESVAAAVTNHHVFLTVLAATCQTGCVRVNGIAHTLFFTHDSPAMHSATRGMHNKVFTMAHMLLRHYSSMIRQC
jgi:hypothetical protein